jgi:hypothetical protein
MAVGERISALESNLGRLITMIGAADSRAGFILAVATAMLGVLAALIPQAENWDTASAILGSISAVGLFVCLLFLSFAAIPRTKGPRGSVVFFEGISARSEEGYAKTLAGLRAEEYADDLARQCHRNAEIAKTKFTWLQRSLVVLYASVPFWSVAVFLLYLRKA